MTFSSSRDDAAAALSIAFGRLRRRLAQLPVDEEASIPEMSALARLDRSGPQTASDLAKVEQISPQSMSATVASLEAKGLIEKTADPNDGRRAVLSLTEAGREVISFKRAARRKQLATAMEDFTELQVGVVKQAAALVERIADRL